MTRALAVSIRTRSPGVRVLSSVLRSILWVTGLAGVSPAGYAYIAPHLAEPRDRSDGGESAGGVVRDRSLVSSGSLIRDDASSDPEFEDDTPQNIFVQFTAAPAAQVYVDTLSTRAASGSSTAAQPEAARSAQAAHFAIEAEHAAFLEQLASRGVEFDLLFRASRSINGVALRATPEKLDELRRIPGVARVELIPHDELQHATSMPYIGAPRVWDNAGGLPAGSTGRGVSIGIIDTGIDYQHASFGGTGALADYRANDRTIVTDANPAARFPTAKVVGGFDFVGDAYNAGSPEPGNRVPTPDPDPMDCNGHGSHVAGTAAGFGVGSITNPTAPPTAYAGPWNSTTDYARLPIAPGVAPHAELHALRIFGCGGSTVMTVAAIEWSMDPDGDGDMSDHLDVINLSLGSRFGRFHPSAIAADAAASVGIVVVAAAGNDGDTTFVAASPGSASRVLSVANVQHAPANGGISYFSSRGPVGAAQSTVVKPDLAAPGTGIRSVQTGITCDGVRTFQCIASSPTGYLEGSRSLVLTGTSMAAPHVAGVAALLRDLYPTRSVEVIKAMIINSANRDVARADLNGVRYPASRVGGGQVDAARAAAGSAALFNDEDPSVVSISFESAVRGTVTRTRFARLVNYSASSRTFQMSLDTVTDSRGLAFSLGAPVVTVPANGTTTIPIHLTADADAMDHTRDPSKDASISIGPPDGAAVYPMDHASEESALLKLSQGGAEVLRLPVYALVYPESAMSAPAEVVTGGAASGTSTIALSGRDVCTGVRGIGWSCAVTLPHDQVSLVSGFELQAVSPRNRSLDPAADLRHVGVAYTPHDDQLHFAVSTYGPWASPSDVGFSVEVDCGVYAMGADFAADTCSGLPDGRFDMRLFSTNQGDLFRFFPLDASVSSVTGLHPGREVPENLWGASTLPPFTYVNGGSVLAGNSRLHDNEVRYLSAPRAWLKVDGRFSYRVSSCPSSRLCGQRLEPAIGPLTWDRRAQGLGFVGGLRAQDVDSAALPVVWNRANLVSNGSLGGLLLHHHNGRGDRAEVVVLEGTASGDIAVGLAVSDAAPLLDTAITYRMTMTNQGADAAGNVSTVLELPAGVAYVADTGTGAFDPTTGTWTVASLGAGATVTIDVSGRVAMSGPQVARAVLSTVAPIDVVPGNDQATVTIRGSAATPPILFRDSFE